MTSPIVHTLQLTQVRPGWWRATCSCGDYRSAGSVYKGNVESAWEAHARSKRGFAA
jgi:hypothetical protein